MKRCFMIFCAVIGILCYQNVNADTGKKIYVDPTVAKNVIEKHFGHLVSEYSKNTQTEFDDNTILINVLDAYNDMLRRNDGFVSVDGIIDVCNAAFRDFMKFAPGNTMLLRQQLLKNKCLSFTKDLVTTKPAQTMNPGCPYQIGKVNDSQMKIRYVLPNNSGFVREGGSIAWRLFNPGNLRGSRLQCTTIRTKPNGTFAVFANAEMGKQALHELLSSNPQYVNLTVKQAIYKYAPQTRNDTEGYINKLRNAGININTKLSDLTDKEFEKLENMIMTIEGWNKTGTETFF